MRQTRFAAFADKNHYTPAWCTQETFRFVNGPLLSGRTDGGILIPQGLSKH
jgi:hypothetical protein